MLPDSLLHLIELLARLPGVGEKTAQRFALHLVAERSGTARALGEALTQLGERVKSCARCGNIAEVDERGQALCQVCRDSRRDAALLCIVAKVQDLLAIERSGAMRGRYFVLGRLLSPLDGIGPDELPLERLFTRLAEDGVREVIVGEEFEAMALQTGTGTALLRNLDALQVPPRVAHPGDRIPLGRDCTIEVLWPKVDAGFAANDTSLVLRLRAGEQSVLFTGDLQADGMRSLLDSGKVLKSDVLVAMHHGSFEENTTDFVDRVAPAWILSSNDRTLTGKQRRFDDAMRPRQVVRTHEHGAITILLNPEGTLEVTGFITARQ